MIGKCAKCGQLKDIRNHHYKGYETDETVLYCRSCDQKAHYKARKAGRCLLTRKEACKLSHKSSRKRSVKQIMFDTHLGININLTETLSYYTNTGNVGWCASFHSKNGTKIYTEEI